MSKSDDTISRQDAIDVIMGEPTDAHYPSWYADKIKSLPSADAVEVVRCKDCKWHLNGHLCKQLSQYGSIETPPSFYCGFGERREP